MNTEAKQIAALKIKELVTSLNEQIEVANGLDLQVAIQAPHKLSLNPDAQISVEIFEQIKF